MVTPQRLGVPGDCVWFGGVFAQRKLVEAAWLGLRGPFEGLHVVRVCIVCLTAGDCVRQPARWLVGQ